MKQINNTERDNLEKFMFNPWLMFLLNREHLYGVSKLCELTNLVSFNHQTSTIHHEPSDIGA